MHITRDVKATVTSALGNKLQYVPERDCRVVVQVAEDRFITVPGSREDRIDLHVRQLYAFAMRHFPAMPPDPQKENLVEGPRAQADPAVLRRLDNLAARLGFGSDEVPSVSGLALPDRHNERPLLVTTGPGPRLKQRCGKPLSEAHKQDKDLLFIHHLHDERRERGEGVTTFYIRQSIYLAFFGRPGTNGAGAATSSSAPPIPQNVHSPSPRDRNDGQMTPPPLGRVFGGPVAEPTGRAETHRPPTNPEPMEQDVEDVLAIYTQREDSDQYHTNAQVEDEDMMQEDESLEPEPSEAVWEEQEQGLQQEGMQQSNVDYRPQLEQEQDLSEAEQDIGEAGQAVEQQPSQQQEQDSGSEHEHEEVQPELLELREQAEIEHGQDLGQEIESEDAPLEDSEESEQDLQQGSAPGFEAQPEEQRGEHDIQNEAEGRDQERGQNTQELQRAPDRNTFQGIQNLLSSYIHNLENGQVSDEAKRLDSALPDHQSPMPDEEAPQVAIQRISDTENQSPSPLSTPARSPCLASFPEERVPDDTPLAEDSEPTLAQPTPVTPPVPRSPKPHRTRINMKVKRHGAWRDMQPVMVDPNNTADFERRVDRYIREGLRPLNTRLGMLPTRHCFALITDDGTNMILFLPDGEIVLDDETLDNAARFHTDAVAGATLERKRAAEDDLSRIHHARKMRY